MQLQYTYVVLDDPAAVTAPADATYPASGTLPLGISDTGQIFGNFSLSRYSSDGASFLYSESQYVKWAATIEAVNNAGQILAEATDPGSPSLTPQQFVYSGDSYTTLQLSFPDPTFPDSADIPIATALNVSGELAGQVSYWKGPSQIQESGFLYKQGLLTLIEDPSAVASGGSGSTTVTGLNDFGEVIGTFTAGGTVHGFSYLNGSYTTIDSPLGVNTFLTGINNAGQIVGYYVDTQSVQHPFMYDAGAFSPIDFVSGFKPTALNDFGQIVGTFTDAGGVHGLLATPTQPPLLINDGITELYLGYDNRVPDPAGEVYWSQQIGSGMSLGAISHSFSLQSESKSLYPFLANADVADRTSVTLFVESLYSHLFNRAPDSTGETYWIGQLQQGSVAVGRAILAILGGALGDDALTVAHKVTVGDYVVSQLAALQTTIPVAEAQDILKSVSAETSTVASAEAAADAYLHSLIGSSVSTHVNLVGNNFVADALPTAA